MTSKTGLRLVLFAVMIATIGCDRVTKHVASTTLINMPSRSYLADTIRLEYAENAGGFMSLGADLPPWARTALFSIGNALMLAAIVGVAIRSRWSGWTLIGLSLFVAGGASNWIDRLLRGSVVDFINVGLGPLRTGIFNVADVAVMLGAGVFVLATRSTVLRTEALANDAPPSDR